MLTKLLAALVLFALLGFRAEAQDTELQRIADALDVSTTKTFQFTANGTMYSWREHESSRALAEVLRENLDPGLRFHGWDDAR